MHIPSSVTVLAVLAGLVASEHDHHHHHSHICGIIAPYQLEAIATSPNASPEARQYALDTLNVRAAFDRLARPLLGLRSEPVSRPRDRRSSKRQAHTVNRRVFTSAGTPVRGTVPVRIEGQGRILDRDANDVYDAFGIVDNFYFKVFGRNSIDNKGLALIGNVHYSPMPLSAYNNAFWDGSQMTFGDGDGEIFDRFAQSLGVVGHELTHGVTQYTAGLVYKDQSGALNEAMSDIFGAQIEQYHFNLLSADASWLVGEGLLSMQRRGSALRSLKAPGTAYRNDPVLGNDKQPAHMDQYNTTTADNGGVHINSGIPNKAFYNAAIALGGYSWERAGKIWYETLLDTSIPQDCTFKQFAALSVKHATSLFGADVATTVKKAWSDVGVVN